MGTRGAIGIREDGVDKIKYNHFDSYPTGLGVDMLAFIKDKSDAEIFQIFNFMMAIDENVAPTEEQIEKCKKAKTVNLGVGKQSLVQTLVDLTVGKQSYKDWYCLLRNAQGGFDVHIPPDGVPYYDDSSSFLSDSLFCEWAYIINLDTLKLEIYQGFNGNKDGKGRYANVVLDPEEQKKKDALDMPAYYGVVLVAEIPLDKIRAIKKSKQKEFMEQFENALSTRDDGDEDLFPYLV